MQSLSNPFDNFNPGGKDGKWLPPQSAMPEKAEPASSSQSKNAASIVALTCNAVHNQVYSSSRSGIPLGAVVTPLPEMRRSPGVVRHAPPACTSCCAVISKYCQVDFKTGTWRCIFCEQDNVSPALVAESYQPEGMLKSEAVDFVLAPPLGDATPVPKAVLLMDVSCSSATLEAMKAAVLQILAKLPRRTEVMLITFASSVAVYRLEPAEVASADCFPGHRLASPEMLEVLSKTCLDRACIAPLHSCRNTAEQAVNSLSAFQAEGDGGQQRCLGAAIHTALYLLQKKTERDMQRLGDGGLGKQSMQRDGQFSSSARLLVITTGPPSQAVFVEERGNVQQQTGWGKAKPAAPLMERLAEQANEQGAVIDILAVGVPPDSYAELSKLASDTSGLLLLRKAFTPFFASNAVAALTRRVGVNGIIDLHLSKELKVIQIMGDVAALDRGPQGMLAKSQSGFLHSNDAVELGMVERGQAVGVCFDVQSPSKATHVYFQAVISWTAEDKSSVHRVVTRQLQVLDSHPDTLKTLDCEIASLLLAKRVVQKARYSGAASNERLNNRIRNDIGKHLEHVAKMVGEPVEYAAGWFAKKKRWSLPQDLAFFSEALYQLQRGPILGGSSCPPEEQILLQDLFLNAAPPVALRMLAPELHLLERGSGQFNAMLAADIALWSDSAAIIDTGVEIHVWLGKAIPAGMPDPSGNGTWTRTSVVCERQATRLAAERFPVPELTTVTEGTKDASKVVSRLIPIRQDTLEEQEEQLPAMAFLTEEQLTATLARQDPTEELSLMQWTRSVGVQPPPPPDNFTEILQGMAAARATSIGIASMGSTRTQSLANRRQHSQKLMLPNKSGKAETTAT